MVFHTLSVQSVVAVQAQGCRWGGGGESSLEFKLMLLCVHAVTTKGHPNFFIIEKQLLAVTLTVHVVSTQ